MCREGDMNIYYLMLKLMKVELTVDGKIGNWKMVMNKLINSINLFLFF